MGNPSLNHRYRKGFYSLFKTLQQNRFSYLMLFDDYNKIDLTLLPLEELDNYLKGDKLIKVL
ncbi:aminoglycoside 6-adenylyltransferase, partial [Enterococcus faecium]|uniref:aminoglycoside 6-adenylyltransferase n=1 Tax=Enterococcus faecium TaxID=1352 RepID=UPI00387AB938